MRCMLALSMLLAVVACGGNRRDALAALRCSPTLEPLVTHFEAGHGIDTRACVRLHARNEQDTKLVMSGCSIESQALRQLRFKETLLPEDVRAWEAPPANGYVMKGVRVAAGGDFQVTAFKFQRSDGDAWILCGGTF